MIVTAAQTARLVRSIAFLRFLASFASLRLCVFASKGIDLHRATHNRDQVAGSTNPRRRATPSPRATGLVDAAERTLRAAWPTLVEALHGACAMLGVLHDVLQPPAAIVLRAAQAEAAR
jgi:hypothetical protein